MNAMPRTCTPSRLVPALLVLLLAGLAASASAATVTYYEHLSTRVFNTTAPLGTLQSQAVSFGTGTTKAWVFTKDAAQAQTTTITFNSSTTFFGWFAASAAASNNQVRIYWELVAFNESSGAETVICTTPTGASGQLVTSTTQTEYSASCTTSGTFSVAPGLKLRVNVYGFKSSGGTSSIVHQWDTSARNSRYAWDETFPDTAPPQWSQLFQNTSSPAQGSSVLLSAFWTDNVALSAAILETNESGVFQNKSGVYGSPLALSGSSSYSNFTWDNDSVAAGTTVAWRIWANDSSNNFNVTNTTTFTVQAAAADPSVSTNQAQYRVCGVVWYRIRVFDNASNPQSAPLTIRVVDANDVVQSETTGVWTGASGTYDGNYSLNASSALGRWLLRVFASNVLGEWAFLVGQGGSEAWQLRARVTDAAAKDRLVFVQGQNATLNFSVLNQRGVGVPGLVAAGNVSVTLNGGAVSGVVDDGQGFYRATVNTSSLPANAAHVFRASAVAGTGVRTVADERTLYVISG